MGGQCCAAIPRIATCATPTVTGWSANRLAQAASALPKASRRRPRGRIPARSRPRRPPRNPERPLRNPRKNPPDPNRARRKSPGVRVGGRLPTSPSGVHRPGAGHGRGDAGRSADRPGGLSRWLARTTVLRKRKRAFGDEPALRRWRADRTMQFRETPLPALGRGAASHYGRRPPTPRPPLRNSDKARSRSLATSSRPVPAPTPEQSRPAFGGPARAAVPIFELPCPTKADGDSPNYAATFPAARGPV